MEVDKTNSADKRRIGGPRRVTLLQVAEASGVSPSTVSFVLNEAPGQSISASTQQRVRRKAAELGYVPHGPAKALREGASRIVILRVEVAQEGHYTQSYIRGLDDELAAHDHVLLVRYGEAPAGTSQRMLEAIMPRAVLRFGAAYVNGNALEDSGGGWDDGLAAHAALQIGHLADRGHRHLALALPEPDAPLGDARLAFSAEVAASRGLPPPAPLVVPHPRDAGAEALRAFLAEHPEVTAVAGLGDDVALRVLAAMRRLGLRAPDDLAVIGYDATDYGALTSPALTTILIDGEGHGRRAARSILGLPVEDVDLNRARLIQREST